MKTKVILDCDDVLFHCNSVAVKMLNREKGTHYTLEDIKEWKPVNGGVDERIKYFSDPRFYENLPVNEGAKKFVSKLSDSAEIFVMTSVPLSATGNRVNAIIKNFPEIDPSNIMIGKRKDLLRADFMLDDCIDNLANSQVTYPVLFQMPWNQSGNSGMLSVNGFPQFLSLVETLNESRNAHYPSALVFTGPSGSGKGSLVKELIKKDERFKMVETYTTKPSKKFRTVSKEKFLDNIRDFEETSRYMGDFYGVKKEAVEKITGNGQIPVFITDINGMMAFKHKHNALCIFVKNSKEGCIRNILHKNMSEEDAVRRITAIDAEMNNEILCDVTVDNKGYTSDRKWIGELL